jgi:enoyl-[acyl-carrier protein] reductase II
MKTRLTELLGIEHPVMLAGMGGVSYSALAAAVSNAGGYGCLGASTMSSAQLAQEIAATRALTAKPFGVDLLTAFPDTLANNVELLIEGGASTFVAGLGVPTHVVDLCHDHHVLVISMCGKVDHARKALDAVGATIPVVAAGGIFDGRGLAAALALGADGVWVGTRFIATPEARTIPGYQDRLLESREDGTIISRAFSGKTMRVIKNETTDRYEADPTLLRGFPDQLMASLSDGTFHLGGDLTTPGVDPHREGYPAGQAVGGIHDIVAAGDIVRQMVFDAEGILARLAP